MTEHEMMSLIDKVTKEAQERLAARLAKEAVPPWLRVEEPIYTEFVDDAQP